MTGTRIYEVRAALSAGIGEALATEPSGDYADVLSSLLWKPNEREQVFTTRCSFTQDPAVMRAGRTHRTEKGQLDLVVLVAGVGESGEWAAQRAAAIGALAEEWVADHRTDLGVDGVNWIVAEGQGSARELFGDRATWAEVTYRLQYQARLV